MQKILHTLVLTFLLVFTNIVANAHDFEVNGVYYNINKDGKTVTVTYKGKDKWKKQKHKKTVVIPSTVYHKEIGYTVTAIGECAFCKSEKIEVISIPPTVTKIEKDAFWLCSTVNQANINNLSAWSNYEDCPSAIHYFNNGRELTDLIIPEDIDSIGVGFSELSNLKSISIHEGVRYIAPNAFQDCNNVEKIIVDPNNQYYDSRGNCNALIETATNKLLKGSKNTTIPSSVTEIADNAFSRMGEIKTDFIPWGVVKIGEYAFYACRFKSLVIPNTVISIGNAAFGWCRMSELEIPGSVLEMGDGAFQYNDLHSAVINGENHTTITDNCFRGNPFYHDVEAERRAAELAAEKQAKKQRRAQLWGKIGAAVAGVALIGAAAYVSSQSGGSDYGSAYVPSYSSSTYNSGSSTGGKLLTMSDSEFSQHIQQRMQVVMQQTAQNMEMQRQHFIAQYRANYYNTHGKMPSESEEMNAYTNYLSAQNDVYQAERMAKYGVSSSSSSYDSSSASSNSNYHNCTKVSASDNAHCNGTGICQACNGSGMKEYGMGNKTLQQCKTCGGTGKCPSCGGDGKR